MDASAEDEKATDQTRERLYANVCLETGGGPPLEELRELFVPEGRLIDNNGDEPVSMTANEFAGSSQVVA